MGEFNRVGKDVIDKVWLEWEGCHTDYLVYSLGEPINDNIVSYMTWPFQCDGAANLWQIYTIKQELPWCQVVVSTSCHYDNLWCHHCQQSWHYDSSEFSAHRFVFAKASAVSRKSSGCFWEYFEEMHNILGNYMFLQSNPLSHEYDIMY